MAEYDLVSKTALLRHLDMAMECKNCPRNANKDLYKCVHNPTSEHCSCSDIAHICNTITEFATYADVQPLRRGRWYGIPDGLNDDIMCCSECERQAYWDSEEGQQLFDYCPYCGAKMDLKEEEK